MREITNGVQFYTPGYFLSTAGTKKTRAFQNLAKEVLMTAMNYYLNKYSHKNAFAETEQDKIQRQKIVLKF